jgi:hypothetical protein
VKASPHSSPSGRRTSADLLSAWLAATLLSGLPSTAWALATGGDALEATRAAGAMLLPQETSMWKLIGAAAIVHPLVSLFWSVILWRLLPRRATLEWALLAAVLIGLLDLELIAPAFFPAVAALDFWPQMADHLAWGFVFGLTVQRSSRGR